MGREEIRAADVDREAVAEKLRTALGEGRLDLAEFDERLGRAYAAKTYGELDGLLKDLPGVTPAEGQRLAVSGVAGDVPEWPIGPDGRYADATRRWLLENWAPFLGVMGVLLAVWALPAVLSGEELPAFWPAWVAVTWGMILVISTLVGLSIGEAQRWAAKQERKKRHEQAVRDDIDE